MTAHRVTARTGSLPAENPDMAVAEDRRRKAYPDTRFYRFDYRDDAVFARRGNSWSPE
jgi:hypothetical protein